MRIYLDLLPKQKKNELRRKKIFRRILSDEFLFLLPVVLFILILFNILYLLSFEQKTSSTINSQTQSQDKYQLLTTYENKFKEVNENASLLLKIQDGHLYWSNVLERVSETLPAGIAITDFSTKDYRIFLIGKAKNRDTLLNFKSNLEANACFSDVVVPLSDLVVKDNVDFQMDFSVNSDCLKNKNDEKFS